MLVKSTETLVKDTLGNQISILQPMVKKTGRPTGGWFVTITVQGTKMMIGCFDPKETIELLRDLLKTNRVECTENQLWTTANLQWLSRTTVHQHRVSIVDYIAQCDTSAQPEAFRGRIDRESWIPSVTDTIGFFLSIDTEHYRSGDLANLVSSVSMMFDPAKAHRLGDQALFATFLEHYTIIRYKPCHRLEEAKVWFVGLFNALSTIRKVTPITEATAEIKYNWNNGTQN